MHKNDVDILKSCCNTGIIHNSTINDINYVHVILKICVGLLLQNELNA